MVAQYFDIDRIKQKSQNKTTMTFDTMIPNKV